MDGAGITELANRLDISKGTIHTHLSTLIEHGFIVKDGKTYHRASGFWTSAKTSRTAGSCIR